MMRDMKLGLYFRKVQSQVGFGKPSFVIDETDGGSFSKADVVRKLPTPQHLKGSQRKSNQLVYNVDLSKWDIKDKTRNVMKQS